jgi:regulator of protease activity HflC (stomatin/prohibitin superfamily)
MPTRQEDYYMGMSPEMKWILIIGGIFIGFLILIALASLIWQVIPAGHVGVMETLGEVNPNVYSSGLVFPKNPFSKFNLYNMRLQKLNINNLEASDKEGQLVYANITINFKLKDKDSAKRILLEVGKPDEYVQIMALEEKTLQGFKQTITQYEAMQILEKREEVSNKARDSIFNRLPTDLLDIESINIVNIEFTQGFDNAIERKKIAEQEALASENEVKVAQAEAKKQIAEAEGDKRVTILNAEAQAEQKLVNAKAEAESLMLQKEQITPLILQLRQIEAQVKMYERWDGALPQFVCGQSIPFINMDNMFKSQTVTGGNP